MLVAQCPPPRRFVVSRPRPLAPFQLLLCGCKQEQPPVNPACLGCSLLSSFLHQTCFITPSAPRQTMVQFSILAATAFALLLSSTYALPTTSASPSPSSSSSSSSSTIITGQVPTVTNPQGLVDPHLFRRNLDQTFAKYRFTPVRGGGGGNATLTLAALNARMKTSPSSMRRVQKKRGEQDSPTRIELAIITREPAIGLVRAGSFFPLFCERASPRRLSTLLHTSQYTAPMSFGTPAQSRRASCGGGGAHYGRLC